jgi:MarR family transcriptional regulator for hemolysin
VTSTQERFSAALHHSARSWRQALDRRLKYLGLSLSSWLAITTIAKAGQPLSQTELASALAIENPSVVSMVDRLVKSGFVLRQPSPTDRRVKLVVLTDAGREVYDKVVKEARTFRTEMLSGIDEATLLAMVDVLESLQAAAEASE